MGRGNTYPPELRERAVRMVAEVRPEYPSDWPAIKAVAAKLGIGSAETLRKLRAEVRELRRANEILKAASAFFAAELEAAYYRHVRGCAGDFSEIVIRGRLRGLAGDRAPLCLGPPLQLAPEPSAWRAVGVVVGVQDLRNGDGRVVGKDLTADHGGARGLAPCSIGIRHVELSAAAVGPDVLADAVGVAGHGIGPAVAGAGWPAGSNSSALRKLTKTSAGFVREFYSASADNRAVPGHWEGDLLSGRG